MEQTIYVWLENKPGALMRVAGVLTSKGCNITSLMLGPDPKRPELSHLTVSAEVEPRLRTKVVSELNRLVNVLEATDVSSHQAERAAC